MLQKKLLFILSIVIVAALALSACGQPAPTQPPVEPEEPFIVGMLLIGPANDAGWSQAHVEGLDYVVENVPGVEYIYLENVYTGSTSHAQTPAELAADMVAKGAKLVVFNSDDQKDFAIKFAQDNPDVYVIHASGDASWEEGKNFENLPNMKNIMGEMEYGKMMAGCTAALTTQTGKIGFLGPLINDETRRFAAAAYLGAKHCWSDVRGNDPASLEFKVNWIGFWFNIPGVTLDPTQVAADFYNTGYDVVISSIDTTEALVEAKRLAADGKQVWAIPYDYANACAGGDDVCLGVPFFNWGPSYVKAIESIKAGTWEGNFELPGPDWANINDPDTSAIGFNKGGALSEENVVLLDSFIQELGGGLKLWTGPLNYQDGTPFLAEGEVATLQQIWYLPQLLEGMEGKSE